MGAIFRREFGAFFTSSIAYIFLGVFWLFSGYFFYAYCLYNGTTDMSGLFQNLFLICVFLIPILTMRLFSEEKKQKTEQGLLTAPVSLGSIVFGKYFAALMLYTIALLMPFVYALILSSFGVVEWGIVFANFLALFLLGGAFIAVGTLISSLTENQIAAAVVSFVMLMALYMVDVIGNLIDSTKKLTLLHIGGLKLVFKMEWITNFLSSISFYRKYYAITCGLFNVSTVVFYISVAVLFNYFTIRVFERRRWS
ncbi:MAG: ABC transporter permease [Oscillospiraceae bacterium]|nr:ABC transporter permease [Oscillospiraceae bacterium]